MKIVFDILHPTHVHLWNSIIKNMKNHEISIIAKPKKCVIELLNYYGLQHKCIGINYLNLLDKVSGTFNRTFRLKNFIQKRNIELGIGMYTGHLAIASKICGFKSLTFYSDNDHLWRGDKADEIICNLFSDYIAVPAGLGRLTKRAAFTYNGVKELAYLYYKHFIPKKEILEKYELEDPYIIIREPSFTALHDIGLDEVIKIEKYIKKLKKYGDIVIIPGNRKKISGVKNLVCSPDIHHIIYFASLFIGDCTSTNIESAVLGTPTIKVSKLWTPLDRQLIENKILEYYDDGDFALQRASEILENDEKNEWRKNAREFNMKSGDVQVQIVNGIKDILKKIEQSE